MGTLFRRRGGLPDHHLHCEHDLLVPLYFAVDLLYHEPRTLLTHLLDWKSHCGQDVISDRGDNAVGVVEAYKADIQRDAKPRLHEHAIHR